jgi:hypothetical protein
MNNFYSETEQTKIDQLAKNGILVEWLSGLCPVQAQGWVDEKHAFYFRSRHAEWSMSITKGEAMDLDEAISVIPDESDVWQYFEDYGKDPEAGYMPFIEALGFIEQSVGEFRVQVA